MGDEVVIKYKDIVLRSSDLDVLEGPCFLNDQIIGFYFSYLTSLIEGEDDGEIAFVLPSVSFWLANCDAESRKDAVEPLNLQGKRLVVFAVNDCGEDESGGTHWSTVVFDRSRNSFLHLDTMQGMNHDHAFKLYETLKEYVGGKLQPQASASKGGNKKKGSKKKGAGAKHESCPAAADENVSFDECEAPQQTNGYDCGVYVLAIAKAIAEFYDSGKRSVKEADWLSFVHRHVDTSIEMTFRNEVMRLIDDLKEDTSL